MPAHIVSISEHSPAPEQLADAVKRLEAREEIISVVPAGSSWVVVTRKKVGRPTKETRVSAPAETR